MTATSLVRATFLHHTTAEPVEVDLPACPVCGQTGPTCTRSTPMHAARRALIAPLIGNPGPADVLAFQPTIVDALAPQPIPLPRRIQRRRTKGWRTPPGAVYVGRPTKWGNPFRFDGGRLGLACEPGAVTGADWEYEDRISAAGMDHDYYHPGGRITHCTIRELTRAESVDLYREALTGATEHLRQPRWQRIGRHDAPITPAIVRAELAGRDLACWCPLVDKDGNHVPCHADVLLEVANPEVTTWPRPGTTAPTSPR